MSDPTIESDPRDQLVQDAETLTWAESQIDEINAWDLDAEGKEARQDFRDLCERYRFAAAHGQQAAMDGEQSDVFAEFGRVLALLGAAENLSREDFDAAQKKARPQGYDDYIEGLWIPWKRGGLLWLACRSDEAEKRAVFEAVLRQAEAGS